MTKAARRAQETTAGPTAIGDSADPPLGVCHCGALRKASRRMSLLYDAALAPYGIKITQRGILRRIALSGAPTINELAAAMVMDAGALNRNLRPLEREGWIQSLVDPKDRRVRRVALTEAGKRKLEETAEAWNRSQDAFALAIGGEIDTLRALLGRVISHDFSDTYEAHARGDER